MMPQLVSVRVQSGQRRSLRFWIPVLPVLVVLSPLLLVGLLVLLVGLAGARVNPGRAVVGLWDLFCSASGLRLDIHDHENNIHISVT
ncbi:MAG TPA: hypothetical protein VH561_14870 [Micromonosporaceae bacterium]|jgi:hypothetical protein